MWPEDDALDDTMIINMGPQHPSTHGVLRLMMELDSEEVAARQARDRLPPHRHGEDRRGAHLRAGRHQRHAHGLRVAAVERARLQHGGRAAARHRGAAARDVDPHDARRAQPHVVAPAVPGDERHGHRRGVDDALRLARARRGAALPRVRHRPADEPQLHPARRCRRRPARRLAGARARAVRHRRGGRRRVRRAALGEPDLARAHGRHRPHHAPRSASRAASPDRSCARPASRGTCARRSRTSRTTRSTSTSSTARTATCSTATASGSRRSSSR